MEGIRDGELAAARAIEAERQFNMPKAERIARTYGPLAQHDKEHAAKMGAVLTQIRQRCTLVP